MWNVPFSARICESISFCLGLASEQLTWLGLQYTLGSPLWVPQKFFVITPISALCLPPALSTSFLTSAHTVTSCLTELHSLPFALGSLLQNKRTTSLLSSHSLFRWTKRPKQMPSITHIHSGTNAVLCSSHKTSVWAGELHDGNWETYWNIHHCLHLVLFHTLSARIWRDDIPVDKQCFKIILIYSASLHTLCWELVETDWTVLQISPAQTLPYKCRIKYSWRDFKGLKWL